MDSDFQLASLQVILHGGTGVFAEDHCVAFLAIRLGGQMCVGKFVG
jgi:hypothetical protein